MQVVYPNRNVRPDLRTRIASIVTGLLVFVFAGIIYSTHKPELVEVKADLNSPIIAQSESVNVANIYSGTISKNSSLYNELLSWPIPQHLVSDLTSRFSHLFDLRSSKPGDSFKVFVGTGDTIVAFEYLTSDWKRYRLDREGGDFIETVNEIGLDKKINRVEGVIKTSLWDALLPLLPNMEIFSDLSDIFGWEIDFLTEPRIGDTFKLLFETYEKNGIFVKPGKILAAEYVLGNVPHRAFFYEDSTGHRDYYDENGYSLRKSLLKSPLNYRRISSRFSLSRLHPIYKVYRPHLGVDYAAAPGTPVVAAGDGVIVYKGWRSGFGNYLEIRHPSNLVTSYGHLQGYARGLSSGDKVNQGEIIGFVGATGDATGPHLDYRVKKNGNFVDPLKMIMPASMPVGEKYKTDFQQIVIQYMPMLEKGLPEPVLAQHN